MAEIKINFDLFSKANKSEILKLCPFAAIEESEKAVLVITSACKMCMLCVKKGPAGLFVLVNEKKILQDYSSWKDIIVYADISNQKLHPVTFELIGKAQELAQKVSQKVKVVLIGSNLEEAIESIKQFGPDAIITYSHPNLIHYLIEPYTAILEEFVLEEKPNIILFGGTILGRSLAPRLAARLRTGLTADCTQLDIQANKDLDQIRPAFGGNIMAHIRTKETRPQIATVRYKIFNKPERKENPNCKIIHRKVNPEKLKTGMEILEIKEKQQEVDLVEAETIIAIGNGIKKKDDLTMIYQLANLLNAQIAGSRPLIEKGWIDQHKQIGLSGRTVRPKLLITCGISGSVQFIAGMEGSENIIAINIDENAPIFRIAHHGFVGDLYSILPGLLKRIAAQGRVNAI